MSVRKKHGWCVVMWFLYALGAAMFATLSVETFHGFMIGLGLAMATDQGHRWANWCGECLKELEDTP